MWLTRPSWARPVTPGLGQGWLTAWGRPRPATSACFQNAPSSPSLPVPGFIHQLFSSPRVLSGCTQRILSACKLAVEIWYSQQKDPGHFVLTFKRLMVSELWLSGLRNFRKPALSGAVQNHEERFLNQACLTRRCLQCDAVFSHCFKLY